MNEDLGKQGTNMTYFQRTYLLSPMTKKFKVNLMAGIPNRKMFTRGSS
jgi:hypothetical protein